MKSKDGVKQSSLSSYSNGYKNRLLKVKERLENQLEKGVKPGKKPVRGIDVPLEEVDIKRIKKELLTIKNKL